MKRWKVEYEFAGDNLFDVMDLTTDDKSKAMAAWASRWPWKEVTAATIVEKSTPLAIGTQAP